MLESDTPESELEWKKLIPPLTTLESFFFRDKGQFALLQNWILPELIERRKAQRSLRIWSAGCASGEEAYSLAIIVDELLPYRDRDELANKLGLQLDDIPNELFRGKGCQECKFSGYKGRIGIFEMVEINDQLRAQINNGANSFELFQIARLSGMRTIAEDGILKAFMGFTTFEEMSRMTKFNNIDRRFISQRTPI